MIFLSYLEYSAYESSGYVMQCLMFEQVIVLQSFCLSWLLYKKLPSSILLFPFMAGQLVDVICAFLKKVRFFKNFFKRSAQPKKHLGTELFKGQPHFRIL